QGTYPDTLPCLVASVWVIVLAPDTERSLRRLIGDREQHRLLRRLMRIALPGRHHEHVVGAPFQHLVLDLGGAATLGADEDGAVGRAVFLALEALRQQRQMGANRGQHRPAVHGIGIALAYAMTLVDVARFAQTVEDRPRARIGVVEHGAALEL